MDLATLHTCTQVWTLLCALALAPLFFFFNLFSNYCLYSVLLRISFRCTAYGQTTMYSTRRSLNLGFCFVVTSEIDILEWGIM